MSLEVTKQELLKQAIYLSKLYATTRNQEYKDQETRVRRIVVELDALTLTGLGYTVPTLAQVTTAGNTTTNAITVGNTTINGTYFQNAGSPIPIIVKTSNNEVAQYFSTAQYAGFRVVARNVDGVPYIGLNTSSTISSNGVGTQKAFFAYWGDTANYSSLGYGNSTNVIAFNNATGNVVISTGTTFTDAGYKLDVNGTTRLNGEATLTSITANTVINTSNNGNLILNVANYALELRTTNPQSASGSLLTTGDITRTDSQTKNIINVNNSVSSTAAAFATLNGYAFTSTINQTLGIIRGLFIAPTLTASTNFRAIETTVGNVIFGSTSGNVLIGTTTDSGQKLQVSGKVFIKGTTSLTATKVFEVQNGAGDSIMDFRDNQYAFFGCGQGGGSATGFIFNYSNTSYCQFSGYNYGAGAGAYKPILLDTDIVGRGNGVFVNFGVSTNPPPNGDTEFGVRGRTADTTSFIARFRNSSNTDMFAIRADGALYTDSQQGYSGTLSIPGNPPGSTTITITNGLITNIA